MFGFIVFAPYFICFFSYPFVGNSRETSLYYYWKVTDCLAGCFTKIFLNLLHYIWTFLCHFVRVLCKIFYTPSLLLESFKPFVGVFLKKFIKISHRVVFFFFNHPQFMLENSVHKPRIFHKKRSLIEIKLLFKKTNENFHRLTTSDTEIKNFISLVNLLTFNPFNYSDFKFFLKLLKKYRQQYRYNNS